jgi:hypothetical protein
MVTKAKSDSEKTKLFDTKISFSTVFARKNLFLFPEKRKPLTNKCPRATILPEF